MSTPKNHHYVSQCHQKEFFNDSTGLIYVYDKELNNHYSKQTSKSLFSEDQLNTRESNGNLDQSTLETELKLLFEDEFSIHTRQVEGFLKSQDEMQKSYESMCWLTMLGILGEIRHPYFKKNLDKILLDVK